MPEIIISYYIIVHRFVELVVASQMDGSGRNGL